MEGKYLITTDNWFYAPDGLKYRSAWGDVSILKDDILGVDTNRNSSNWFAKVGDEHNHVIIAGCQIHYAVKCQRKPNSGHVSETTYDSSGSSQFYRPTEIYIAE